MKATINGIQVEGTPQEIHQYVMLASGYNTAPTYVSPTIAPYTSPYTWPMDIQKWVVTSTTNGVKCKDDGIISYN